jgi:hypothetical protein
MTIKKILSLVLLLFVPISIAAEFFDWGTLLIIFYGLTEQQAKPTSFKGGM